jgi:hypothetical protein
LLSFHHHVKNSYFSFVFFCTLAAYAMEVSHQLQDPSGSFGELAEEGQRRRQTAGFQFFPARDLVSVGSLS